MVLLKRHVAEVEESGDEGIDGHLLVVAHAHRSHRLVGQLEVLLVVQLDISERAAPQELGTHGGERDMEIPGTDIRDQELGTHGGDRDMETPGTDIRDQELGTHGGDRDMETPGTDIRD